MKSPIRNVRETAKYTALKNEFEDLLAHIDRRRYELSFLKCNTCPKCLEYSSDSKHVVKFMIDNHSLHFETTPSNKKEHFMTFLDQEKNNVKPTPDVGLSSKEENNVGSCSVCPSLE